MSEDPYEGSTGNIMTQNRYAYAENDPVNRRDPGGHRALLKKIKRSARRVAKKVVKTVKTVASRVISSVRGAPKKIASAVKSASNYSRASAKATLGYVRTKYKSAEQRAKDIRKTLKAQYNSLRKKVSCGIHSGSKNNNVVVRNNFLASLDKTEISASDTNLDGIHTMLDAVGVVDPFGISDGINALIYLGQGDFKNAGISALGIVPYIGDTAKGARLGAKALKFADKADDVADAGKALKKAENITKAGTATRKAEKVVEAGKSAKAVLKKKQLPTKGKIRYIPPDNWTPSQPLPKKDGQIIDKFGNRWIEGPSRTKGQLKEWDVQLSQKGSNQLGWASRDGSHLNVSLDGKITHK